MNVLVLVGSLRANSLNGRLADATLRHLPSDITAATWSRLGELPFYNEDLDTADEHEVVADLRAAVAAADALLIATPEYNGSIPGALKNAIDWASRPRGTAALTGKPVAVVAASASPRGAVWAREDLVKVLRVAGAQPIESTVGVGSGYTAFSEGSVTDVEIDRMLFDLVGELIAVETAAA